MGFEHPEADVGYDVRDTVHHDAMRTRHVEAFEHRAHLCDVGAAELCESDSRQGIVVPGRHGWQRRGQLLRNHRSRPAVVATDESRDESVLRPAGDHGPERLVDVERTRTLSFAFAVASLNESGRNHTAHDERIR